jgi:hypothetical protein
MAKKTRTIIWENISHGDFQQEKHLFVNIHNVSSVEKMLNSCCYLLIADDDSEEVAQRKDDAKRVSKELIETGESYFGWVTYTAPRILHGLDS